jgi:hypothetical protein
MIVQSLALEVAAGIIISRRFLPVSLRQPLTYGCGLGAIMPTLLVRWLPGSIFSRATSDNATNHDVSKSLSKLSGKASEIGKVNKALAADWASDLTHDGAARRLSGLRLAW